MRTQWRMGFSGSTGLDYIVLMQMVDRLRLDDEDADELIDEVRIMEFEALKMMRAKDE
jgi:hypothetical protein